MTREKGLETIIVLTLVSLVVYLKFPNPWLIYLSLALLVTGTISTKATLFIGAVWFKFSHYFGMVMNVVIMGIIFYLFLTPLALVQRIVGKNKLRIKPYGDSFFQQRQHLFTKKDIEKPW
ncbi:SxtJ family membrane protein [Aegicerativicinus sediminis]|uniref:SxtJ family membrane protein n=1 Tax=Aegicerativicinus sediminis TaxID=2893202 RepID=UPI001E57350B|nr:SxtJ family membrane protein [Aegicerativicinus sediminis]